MDLTPKPSGRSLFGCCRPSPPSASVEFEQDDDGYSNEDIPTPTAANTSSSMFNDSDTKVVTFDKSFDIPSTKRGGILAEKVSLQKEIVDIASERDDLIASKESHQKEMADIIAVHAKEVENRAHELHAEKDSMQHQIVKISTERDVLSSEKDSMQQQIESLLNQVAEITTANIQEVETLKQDLLETSLTKEGGGRTKDEHIDNLQKDLERVRSTLIDTSAVRDELSTENGTLQQQIDTLQGTMTQISSDREEDREVSQLELELAREHLEESEGETKKLTGDLEACQGRIEEADDSIKRLYTQLDTARADKDELNKEMTAWVLYAMTKEKEETMKQLNSKIASLEDELHEAKQVLPSIVKSLEDSHAEALARVEDEKKELMSQKEEVGQRIEGLSAEIEHANENNISISAELNGANAAAALEHERLNAKIASLVADLLEATQVGEKLSSAVKSSEGSHAEVLARFESEKKEATSQKEEAEQRLEGLSAELENANDKVCSLSTELNDAKKAATQEQEQLGSKIKSLESDLQESKEEERRLGGAMKSLESSHVEALARVDGEKNASIQVLEQKMDDIVGKSLGAMEEQLKKRTSEKETLDKELTSSKDQCSALTMQFEAKKLVHDTEREALSLKLSAKETNEAESEAARVKLNSSIALLVKERDGFATELNEAKQKEDANSALIEDLQSQQDVFTKKVSELAKCVDSANTEKESLSKAKDELSAENSSLQEKIQTLQTNVLQITAAKEAELGNLQHELESVRKQLVNAEENTKRLAIDLETHQGRLETANASIIALHTEKENTLDNFDSKISSLEADLLQSKKEGEIGHSAIRSLERSHLETLAKTEGEINDLMHHKQEMAQRIESLWNDIEGSNEKCTSISVELKNVKEAAGQEHERLGTKITTLEADLLQSKQSTADKMAQAETLQEALQKDLEAVQKSLTESTKIRDELLAETDATKKEITTLSSNVSQVSSAKDEEIGDLQQELGSVRKQREDAEANATRLTDDLGAIQNRLQMAEHRHVTCEYRLQSAEMRDDIMAEKKSTEQKIETLQRETDDKMADAETLQKDLEAVQKSLTDTTKIRDELLAETDATKKEITTLSSNVSPQVSSDKDEEIGDLQQELGSVRKQREDAELNATRLTDVLLDIMAEKKPTEQKIETLQREIENLQNDLETATTERVLAKEDSMQHKVEALETKVKDVTAKKEVEIANLRKGNEPQSADNDSHLRLSIEKDNMQKALASVQKQLDDAEGKAKHLTDDLEKYQSRIEEADKESQVEMDQQIETLSTEIEDANEKCTSLSTQLFYAKEAASQVEQQLSSKIQSLEIALLESKKEAVAKATGAKHLTAQSGMTSATQNCVPLLSDISPPAPSEVIVYGFSHQGLTVQFNCTKAVTMNKQTSVLIAKFINTTNAPLYYMHLQVAVPKFVQMEIKPPTSTTVPVSMGGSTKEVTQTIRVTNTMIGTKNLMLKIKASFTSKGKKVEHVTTCSSFPAGQF